jgi:hypothetical protein
MTYPEFKKLFLDLTEWTIPFKQESKLHHLLPKGGTFDTHGNYYITIGSDPTTLFTTHLDTFSDKYEKVKHVIKGETIATDGTTILGGDNKLGTTILCYLIKNNVPGLYAFFVGEEPCGGSPGLWGSRKAVDTETERFSNIKRAIAFDRREIGSIITRQSGRPCCSDEFAEELSIRFKQNGMSYDSDPTGYYTDTASFMKIVPECTNISAGGWGEHTTKEYVKLDYTWKVAQAASKIDWESLPVARHIKPTSEAYNDKELELLEWVSYLFECYDFQIENIEQASKGVTLTIGSYFEKSPFNIKIDSKLYLNEKEINIHILRNILADHYGPIFSIEDEVFTYDKETEIFIINSTQKVSLFNIISYLSFNQDRKTASFTKDGEPLKDDLGFPMRGDDLMDWITTFVKSIMRTKKK